MPTTNNLGQHGIGQQRIVRAIFHEYDRAIAPGRGPAQTDRNTVIAGFFSADAVYLDIGYKTEGFCRWLLFKAPMKQ